MSRIRKLYVGLAALLVLLTGCSRRPADYFPENLGEQAQSVTMICPVDAARGDCDVYEVTEPAQVPPNIRTKRSRSARNRRSIGLPVRTARRGR